MPRFSNTKSCTNAMCINAVCVFIVLPEQSEQCSKANKWCKAKGQTGSHTFQPTHWTFGTMIIKEFEIDNGSANILWAVRAVRNDFIGISISLRSLRHLINTPKSYNFANSYAVKRAAQCVPAHMHKPSISIMINDHEL